MRTTLRLKAILAGLLGALLGAGTSSANNGHGLAPSYTSQVLDAPWTWVAVGLVPCFAARSWSRSAFLGAVALWTAVLCYDLMDLHFGVYTGLASADPSSPIVTDWLNLGSDVVGYGVVATIAAAGLGLIVTVTRRGGVLGLLAQLVVPSYAAWESHARVRDFRAFGDNTAHVIGTNQAVTPISLAVAVFLLITGVARLGSAASATAQPQTSQFGQARPTAADPRRPRHLFRKRSTYGTGTELRC